MSKDSEHFMNPHDEEPRFRAPRLFPNRKRVDYQWLSDVPIHADTRADTIAVLNRGSRLFPNRDFNGQVGMSEEALRSIRENGERDSEK